MSETITLKIVGDNTMHCGGCENTVKFALKQLAGVARVEAERQTFEGRRFVKLRHGGPQGRRVSGVVPRDGGEHCAGVFRRSCERADMIE